ncbi:hypothetical protein KW94_14910 [Clostridioides difficile]|nr:hypothetical protein KW94_14910 [Clostridioides difficile]
MNKINKIFLLINLLTIIFIILPSKSFSQENNCLEDFKNWVVKNEDNRKEIVYTLPCDMIVDNYFEFSIPYGTNITIDTNKYKILIKDKGHFNINGNKLNIIGEGGSEGVIHVEKGGKLNIGIDNIVALNGTALHVEKDANLSIDKYYEEIGNIKANGENAIGIYSENDIRVDSKTIEADGENAIGIYCKGEVEIEDTSIIIHSGNKKQNVLLENKKVKSIVSEANKIYIIGEQNTITPDIPQNKNYEIVNCNYRGIRAFEKEMNISKEDKVEDIILPDKVRLRTSSMNSIDLDVEWDLSNYYNDLNNNTEFIIIGKFKEEDLNEKNIIVNNDVIPVLHVYIVNKEPIDDLEVSFLNFKNGYLATLDYSMPYSAKKVFVEYSEDGVNWVSEELENISNQVMLDFGDFKLRCFRIKVEGGLKEGYSNVFLKPGFVMGGGGNQITPDDEQEVDDDSGDRGGGGRDDPDREDNKVNSGVNNKNNNNTDEQRPLDSGKVTEDNGEEKNNNQQDEENDKSHEKHTEIDKEVHKEKSEENINNKVKNNNLIEKNKIENNLEQDLKEGYKENNELSKNTYNDKVILSKTDGIEVNNSNDKLKSISKPYDKTQSSKSELIIGVEIIVLTMLFSVVVINRDIIKYIDKIIRLRINK